MLIKIKGNRVMLWSCITIILSTWYLFPSNTTVLALSDLSKDTLFFWLGIMFGQVSLEKLKSYVSKPIVSIGIFTMTVIFTFIRLEIIDLSVINMLTCFFTILTLLILPIVFKVHLNLIDNIGRVSFGIYILHWPVMLIIRVLLYQIMGIDSQVVVFLMTICGFVIPYLIITIIKRVDNNKFKKTKRYVLGM